ncbi:MAG: metal ABC transporter substrate-binding protein [Actinomycetia bacterium]|nr:metal ABC transporter substrate-binding protein [Actinomycetes bacterium]
MKFLSDADLLVIVGLDLIPWEEEIITKTVGPDLVVRAGEAVPVDELLPAEGGDDGTEAGAHGAYDPHVWLDPVLLKYAVEAVRKGLEEADPRHASSYRERAASFISELDELHGEIARRTAAFTHREFIAFHSSWTYFARRYGLRQVGVIEERPGQEPSAGEIAKLVEMARGWGVKAVFAEAQFSPRVAEAVAEESGGEVRVWLLDPLGDPGNPEKGDYCRLMRHNLSVMEEALR